MIRAVPAMAAKEMPTGAKDVPVDIRMGVLYTTRKYTATASEVTTSTRSGTLKRARSRRWNQDMTMPVPVAASSGQPKCQVSRSGAIRIAPPRIA